MCSKRRIGSVVFWFGLVALGAARTEFPRDSESPAIPVVSPAAPEPRATLYFANFVPGRLDAPVIAPDGISRLDDTNYVAQLFVAGRAVVPPTRFGQGEKAGYWLAANPIIVFTNYPPYLTFPVRIHVWEAPHGESLDEALLQGRRHRVSPTIVVTTGSTAGEPGIIDGLPSLNLAYGQILFSNRMPGDRETRVYDPDGGFLEGTNYVIQLSIGDQALVPPKTFGSGPDAGYWEPGEDERISLPRYSPGDEVLLQLRIWDRSRWPNFNLSPKRERIAIDFPYTLGGGPVPNVSIGTLFTLSLAPGSFWFRNSPPGMWDFPVLVDKNVALAGTNFVAQLVTGGNFGQPVTPLTPPAPFGVGVQAGYWQPISNGVVVLEGTAPLQVLRAELRVWDTNQGSTWEEAAQNPAAARRAPVTIRLGFSRRHPGNFVYKPRISFEAGSLDFRNLIPGILDQKVFGPDGLPLSGPDYVARLLIRDTAGTLLVSTPAVPFGEGDLAGYWQAGTNAVVTVPSLRPDDRVEYEIQIWNGTTGVTFETADEPRAAVKGWTVLGGLGTEGPTVLRRPLPISLLPGTVDFRNFIPGKLDVPVLGPDGKRLESSQYLAQLYVLDNPGRRSRPVGIPRPFGTGTDAGYWQTGNDPVLFLDGIAAGEAFSVEILVWDASSGATYEEATGAKARSNPFPVTTGIFGVRPPAPLAGLESFALLRPLTPIWVPPGLHFISNPSASPGLPMGDAFIPLRSGTEVHQYWYAWQSFQTFKFSENAWEAWNLNWEGSITALVFNPATEGTWVRFWGEPAPNRNAGRPSGWNPWVEAACHSPDGCDIDDLIDGPAMNGDLVYRIVNGAWTVQAFEFGAWDGGAPRLNYGEACFVRCTSAPAQ